MIFRGDAFAPSCRSRHVAPILLLLGSALAAGADSTPTTAPASQPVSAPLPILPPPPAGVAHVEFNEFFKSPIGRRGAEFTDRAKSLDGKRVRVVGFMVRAAHEEGSHAGHNHGPADNERSHAPKRTFMLSPYPITINDAEYAQADDLPLNTVFVQVAPDDPVNIKFVPGPFVVTGVLELGRREEFDNRVSWVRVKLDEPLKLGAAGGSTSQPSADIECKDHGHKHAEKP